MLATKATSEYTFHVVDLTRFNERYGVEIPWTKPFDTEEVILELVEYEHKAPETKKLRNKNKGDVFPKQLSFKFTNDNSVGVFTEGKGAVNSTVCLSNITMISIL